jgi:hypothetical protein
MEKAQPLQMVMVMLALQEGKQAKLNQQARLGLLLLLLLELLPG